MTTFTRQQLFEALQALPPAIKDIVLSVDSAEAFHTLMKQHGLTVSQIGAVANEVAPVTVGLVLPEKLPLHLKRQLPELSDEQLNKLVADINTLLLKHIRDQVVALAHENKGSAAPQQLHDQPPPAASPSPVGSAPRATPEGLRPGVRTLEADIAQTKLSGSVHLPSDALRVKEPSSTTPPVQPLQKPPPVVSDGTYIQGVDPYREPIA